MDKFGSAANLKKTFSISPHALRKWAENRLVAVVRMPGGKRLYRLDDVKKLLGVQTETRSKICYARVSSSKQTEDLKRQISDLKELYQGYEIIQDVGSALNFKRTGFVSLVQKICSGSVAEIVVMHKDRLCRFGFELFELICEKHNTAMKIHERFGSGDEHRELADDLLAVSNYFVAKNNGRRAAKNRKRRRETAEEQE